MVLDLNDAASHGDGYGVGSIVRAKFRQDASNVGLDGFFGDPEAVGNHLVSISRSHLSQDVNFAFGQ